MKRRARAIEIQLPPDVARAIASRLPPVQRPRGAAAAGAVLVAGGVLAGVALAWLALLSLALL